METQWRHVFCFVHCCDATAWHTVGTQLITAEWINYWIGREEESLMSCKFSSWMFLSLGCFTSASSYVEFYINKFLNALIFSDEVEMWSLHLLYCCFLLSTLWMCPEGSQWLSESPVEPAPKWEMDFFSLLKHRIRKIIKIVMPGIIAHTTLRQFFYPNVFC